MADQPNLYLRAMASAQKAVDGVKASQLHDPTPCAEWDLSQLLNHLVYENLWAGELFQGKTMAEVGDQFERFLLTDDPAGDFKGAVAAATGAASASGAMEGTCHLSFGDFPGSEYAGQLFLDNLVHGWDVAKATGQDTTLDPELVEACYPIAVDVAQMAAGSGAFAASLQLSADADLQTRLLAVLGRES